MGEILFKVWVVCILVVLAAVLTLKILLQVDGWAFREVWKNPRAVMDNVADKHQKPDQRCLLGCLLSTILVCLLLIIFSMAAWMAEVPADLTHNVPRCPGFGSCWLR